jgi:allophanate hydrolase
MPDELPVVVCGAHMSGLPLNGALTGPGGRFLRATRSAPCYRLLALPGGPPARPGMVRVTQGGGPIAVEVWALPRAAVGDLLASIPAPLGLGMVALEDGTQAHGFVCEAAAADGARDITELGGWRAYLAQATAAE